MAKKPTRPKRPQEPVIIIEQPVEETEVKKDKWFNCLKVRIAFIGTTVAACASLFTLANHWDNFNLPRLAFYSEIKNVNRQMINLEIEYRQRAKRNDQRSIYEVEEKINLLKDKHREIPDELYQQRDRLIEDQRANEEKLNKAIKKLDN